jgi:hypothetical protein
MLMLKKCNAIKEAKHLRCYTMPHLIPPYQPVATALAVMEEASITAPRAPDLKLEVPTSIEDPEATMKLIHTTTAALRAPREVGAVTATRRSINPFLVTLMTTSTLAQMSVTA